MSYWSEMEQRRVPSYAERKEAEQHYTLVAPAPSLLGILAAVLIQGGDEETVRAVAVAAGAQWIDVLDVVGRVIPPE